MVGSFEAKKHAYRQTQDGIVVSFVIHPNDVDAAFATAALGTRYMIGFAEIGDDGKIVSGPVAELVDAADLKSADASRVGSNPTGARHKDRKPFASLPLSQQAALRCQDNDFKLFLNAGSADDAAKKVRDRCGIASRAELDDPECELSRKWWLELEGCYQAYLTDLQYADVRR